MLASNRPSVNKVPITSGNFVMIARGQKHRVSVSVHQENQCTSLRVTCQQTGKEWWLETFNGKLWRGFSPDGKLPNCELPAIEFQPVKNFVISPTMGFVDCGGRYYSVPSNEPPDDGFICEDDEPSSDLSRYSEPATDPMTWQEF